MLCGMLLGSPALDRTAPTITLNLPLPGVPPKTGLQTARPVASVKTVPLTAFEPLHCTVGPELAGCRLYILTATFGIGVPLVSSTRILIGGFDVVPL